MCDTQFTITISNYYYYYYYLLTYKDTTLGCMPERLFPQKMLKFSEHGNKNLLISEKYEQKKSPSYVINLEVYLFLFFVFFNVWGDYTKMSYFSRNTYSKF